MKINIQNLEQNLLDVEGKIKSDFLEPNLRRFYPNEVEVLARLDKFGKGYKVDVQAQTRALYKCDRCLKSFEKDLNIRQKQIYGLSNEDDVVDSDTIELPANAIEIDISPVLSEMFTLHHPLKMLCSDSCKGICPKCGADLNTETCSCDEETGDPRWAELKKLIR